MRWLSPAIAALAATAALVPLAPSIAGEQTSGPIVVHLTPYLGVVPSFSAQAGGRESRFLFDTAGGFSVITPAFAAAIECQPWGRVTGFRMRGDRVDVQRCDDLRLDVEGTTLRVPTAGVWDLTKLLPNGAPPLAGSVALDALAGRAITLDLGAGELVLETAPSLAERVAHATELPVRFSRDAQGLALTPLVGVPTTKGRLWMELDSGSDATLVVARHAAKLLGLDPELSGAQPTSLALDGGIRVEGRARVADLIIDGNLGTPVLERWVVTLDLEHERLWVRPRAQAPSPTLRR